MATVTPDTCNSPIGRVVAVKTGAVAPLALTFDGKPLQNMGLCTRLAVSQSVIAQFQNTFESYIYVVPFGDKPGDIAISFIINQDCDTTKSALNVVDYYIKNRLLPTVRRQTNGAWLVRKTAPITVAIGSLTLRGFVTALTLEAVTDGGVIVGATLRMTGWPV